MELSRLIEDLRRPEAYPHPVESVEVIQTHASIVFLAGDYAYKIKKPVDFGFLDYSTVDKRRACCRREVELNRRLAPSVYLGVVPIETGGDHVRIGTGPAGSSTELAVLMRRLDPDDTLLARWERGALGVEEIERVARRIASFHREAIGGPEVAAFGRFDVVQSNLLENLEDARPWIGRTISEPVYERLLEVTRGELARSRAIIERRAERGVPRDTHGDLRLEHVYVFEDRASPEDLAVVDCIEFNDRFRYSDPVADVAFLIMDLRSRGALDLADVLERAYFDEMGDREGPGLLALYVGYRAAVRGKVGSLRADEPEVGEAERRRSARRARALFLLALQSLVAPDERPCLVLVAGLPGTGKSVVAGMLAERSGFEWVRMDDLRKELVGASPDRDLRAAPGQGIYDEQTSRAVYRRALDRAEDGLFEGRRVVVDATFRRESDRRRFLDAARHLGVRAVWFECQVRPEVVRERLAQRRGGPSDADWEVYRHLARQWEMPSDEVAAARVVLDSGRDREDVFREVRRELARLGVASNFGVASNLTAY